ncbi:hypothetical protein BGZ68_002087, partial [Mortierella alpina]
MEYNSIGSDGAKALAEALKTNSTLTTLNLERNSIGTDGAKALDPDHAGMLNGTEAVWPFDSEHFDRQCRLEGTKALAEALKTNSTATNCTDLVTLWLRPALEVSRSSPRHI